jgi:hypothetical protein
MGVESSRGIAVQWVVQIVGWLTAMLMAYGMARSDIAVLQTKQIETDRRLERIELKIDTLLLRQP